MYGINLKVMFSEKVSEVFVYICQKCYDVRPTYTSYTRVSEKYIASRRTNDRGLLLIFGGVTISTGVLAHYIERILEKAFRQCLCMYP